MARLAGLLVTEDESFKAHLAGLLRTAAVPVIVDDRTGRGPDVIVVDGRHDLGHAVSVVEQLRTTDATSAIFFVADSSSPDVILTSMRAGANEFFAWPPSREAIDEAVRRASARRALAPSAGPQSNTIVFFGSKGGAGTTTMAVNCGVEVARLSKRPTVLVDLKPGLGEVSVFLGVRSRYTLLDALDNLHRLDGEFFKELVTKHKSGLEILAGSDLFDRPGSSDNAALEEVFRLLGKQYEQVIVDAGSQLNTCAVTALYTADTICLVVTPDVPSVRNAQRLLDRIGQLGACGDRVRVLLNRAAEPYPIPLAQIETALGHPIDHRFPSDYKTVSAALNSGVPLALSGTSEMATQFDRFTRRVLNAVDETPAAGGRRSSLGLQRFASLW
jgi:pilus assembly protein CpaE